jgi:methyltransferase-like protein
MSASEAQALCGSNYDEVPYTGYPFQQTHPDRLATMAKLAGLEPAQITNCRVLELGCGDGGNLVPMACNLRGSRFLGIDASGRAITEGKQLIDDLNLKNIELRTADFMELGPELGEFDYIIAHGVYSWVPAQVRDRLLDLCRRHLAPQGVAYISYNAYPGFHLRELMREMMLFHSSGVYEPLERVHQSLAALQFISSAYPTGVEGNNDLYGVLVTEHLDLLRSHRHLEQIYHDDLAALNVAVYFHEFVAHARDHGLQFLSEAVLADMDDGHLPDEVRETLAGFAQNDVIRREQYLDFLKCRVFRQTLLCRNELSPKHELDDVKLENFYMSSTARAESKQPDFSRGAIEEFKGLKGGRLRTDHPGAKAALVALGEAYPMSLSWSELVAQTSQRLNVEQRKLDVKSMEEILTGAAKRGLVQLHVNRPAFLVEASERPVASRLARVLADRGKSVTNMLHESVHLDDELSRRFLRLLDGTRDRHALSEELFDLARRLNPDVTVEQMSVGVERNLQRVARSALLVA